MSDVAKSRTLGVLSPGRTMPCNACSNPSVYQVTVIHNRDEDPVAVVRCCRAHLADTIERLNQAFPDHRITPAQLYPMRPTDLPPDDPTA